MMSEPRVRVLLVGATGLVGRRCLSRLQADARVSEIVVLQRAAVDASRHEERITRRQVDFEQMNAVPDAVFAVDAAICALGTTIKAAGSQAAFRRVDHDYALAVAQRARAGGATRFGLVSAIGADAGSRVFYNRVKGETEGAIAALGFDSLSIVRPSLLLGERQEHRLGEKLATPFMLWLPRRWRAVSASNVAQVLVQAVLEGRRGVHRIENAALLGDVSQA